MGKLVLSLRGGMGTRLISVLSARIFTQHLGHEFEVFWPSNFEECHCALEDLFENLSSRPEPVDPASPGFHLVDNSGHSVSLMEERLALGETVYLSTWFCVLRPTALTKMDFDERMYQEAASLKPVYRVLEKIPKIRPETIGFHLRHEDHWRNLRYTPLILFIRVMDRLSKKYPHATFLLATDSPSARKVLGKRYGSQLLCMDHQDHRDSVAGVQAALVDVLSLAQADRIYGSNASTITHLAHLLGKQPRVRMSLFCAPTDYNACPYDRRHDELMRWDQLNHSWKQSPYLFSYKDRFDGFRYLWWTRFVTSRLYQLWPFHRARLFVCKNSSRKREAFHG